DRLGLADAFDHVVDPASVAQQKPAPDMFLAAARALGVAPSRCLGIEDAAAGIAAIKQAGMTAIGVGDPRLLAAADVVVPDMRSLALKRFL
ncbi:MAG: HAD-IA family hydrolase, partial [Proteobacteria bacterium]|nr:HAD-IA family hydrolase [Pseudomonadota bacterium]